MPQTPTVSISAAIDGGNIELAEVPVPDQPVKLKIRPDPYTELEQKSHLQWFYFRATAAAALPRTVSYEIVNAGTVSYPVAWHGAEVCVSTDRHKWRRIASTTYDAERGALCFAHEHVAEAGGAAYFAFFDPYSYDRHLDLVTRCAAAAGATVRSLGQTLDGRELEVVEVGTGPRHVWVIARQHPGEPQAEHFAEGLLTRLLGLAGGAPLAAAGAPGRAVPLDGLAVKLRRDFTWHVVPNMNPDGSIRGHLRTNAGGANLNREWASCTATRDGGESYEYEAPSPWRSPEVFHALAAMDATGVDAFLDVHGDEELPVVFTSGAEGCPNWSPRLKALQAAFLGAYCRANPDVQARFGYTPDPPREGMLNICSNQIAHRFDCLALTYEMPFKDNAHNFNSHSSFQGERCAALGASFLDALAYVAHALRGVDAPAFSLLEDAYVCPTEDRAVYEPWVAAQRAKLA